jgi:glycosyltransferase involved in cell wall biosynthesis
MKVLHAIPSLDPATGGPPMVAISLAAAESNLGCEVQVVSYHFPKGDARLAAALTTVPNIGNVKLEYLPPLTKVERFLARGARRRLDSVVEQFDLIHLHGVWDPLIYAVGSLAARHKKPYVFTAHAALYPWAMSQSRLKKKIALAMGYRRMLNGASFLHYLTQDEKRLTANLQLTPPVHVLPNGIFPEEFASLPSKGTFRRAHPEFSDAKLILYLGRLSYTKGLDLLAEAFAIVSKQFPDARLIIVGPDYGERARFESQIAQLGIASRVHILGPLFAGDKLAALVDCNCFCLPSRQEGFSVAVTEAMACGAPVVISPECHFPEVQENQAGIVAELNPASVAGGIGSILGDLSAAKVMGQNGRELIQSHFTWPKIAEQMVQKYAEVLSAPAIGARA